MESAWRSQLLPESEFPPAYDPKRCLSMLPSSSASSAISTQKLLNASPPPRPPRSATSEESVKDDWGNADDTIRNYYSNYKDLVACAPSTSARTPCSENRVEVSASTPEEAVQDALAVEVVETKAVENIVDTVMVNELLLETMKKSGKVKQSPPTLRCTIHSRLS